MTQRDLEIISMVYSYEGCGVSHIRQVFFGGSANRSIPCYRRLSLLVRKQYLRRFLIPSLNKQFLLPGRNARGILSYLAKEQELKRIRITSPIFMLHKLAICDIRVSLELACWHSPTVFLTAWVNESALRRLPVTVSDPHTHKQSFLIPDGIFTLCSRATGRQVQFYLEMDLATVSLASLRQRVRSYLLLGDFSPVLFVVPDPKRQRMIVQIAKEEAAAIRANPTTIWSATKDRITPESVLSAPWVVAGHETPVTLSGLAAPANSEGGGVAAGGSGGQGE